MKNTSVHKEVCTRICAAGLCIIAKRWKESTCTLYGNNSMSTGIAVPWEILEAIRKWCVAVSTKKVRSPRHWRGRIPSAQ